MERFLKRHRSEVLGSIFRIWPGFVSRSVAFHQLCARAGLVHGKSAVALKCTPRTHTNHNDRGIGGQLTIPLKVNWELGTADVERVLAACFTGGLIPGVRRHPS
jgi:hypothetical protein